jgi:hypothetical protein
MFTVGVSGQMRSGKDEASAALKIYLEHGNHEKWVRAAFAYNVKKDMMDTYGVTAEFIEEWKVKDENPPGFLVTMRKALQLLGDGKRQIVPTCWMDLLFRQQEREHANYIISDVRYFNEVKAVKQRGGFVVLLARPGWINDDPNGSERELREVSLWAAELGKSFLVKDLSRETYDRAPEILRYYDAVVVNNGSLDDFFGSLLRIVVPEIQRKKVK